MNRRPAHPLPRLAFAWILSAILLAGCSMQRIAYNRADWLVLQQMDSYLDLSEPQQARAEAALAVAHRQHRTEQLPVFAAAFADASTRVQRGLTDADVHAFLDRAKLLLEATVGPLLPTVSETLAGLSAEQRGHLATRLEERNDEYAERNALAQKREERLRRRAERTVSRIEDWTGPLSEDQVALVHEIRNAMPDNAADWLAHTRSRQDALLALLDAGAPAADIEALLREWWLFREELPPMLQQRRTEQVDAGVRLVVRLAATLDSVQRAHLLDRLDDLARDARELAVET